MVTHSNDENDYQGVLKVAQFGVCCTQSTINDLQKCQQLLMTIIVIDTTFFLTTTPLPILVDDDQKSYFKLPKNRVSYSLRYWYRGNR